MAKSAFNKNIVALQTEDAVAKIFVYLVAGKDSNTAFLIRNGVNKSAVIFLSILVSNRSSCIQKYINVWP